MRPKGKWLVLGSHQRYLLGRETLVLMGFPLHRMSTMNFPESVTWLTHTIGTWCGWVCQEIWCLLLIPAPKVLQDLGGNSMSVRVVMAVLAAALRATDPQRMTQSWKMPIYVQANVVFNFFGVLGNHGKSNPNLENSVMMIDPSKFPILLHNHSVQLATFSWQFMTSICHDMSSSSQHCRTHLIWAHEEPQIPTSSW